MRVASRLRVVVDIDRAEACTAKVDRGCREMKDLGPRCELRAEHFGIEITQEQVDEMFERIDLDGNGTIDYTEFVMATISEGNLVTEERLK